MHSTSPLVLGIFYICMSGLVAFLLQRLILSINTNTARTEKAKSWAGNTAAAITVALFTRVIISEFDAERVLSWLVLTAVISSIAWLIGFTTSGEATKAATHHENDKHATPSTITIRQNDNNESNPADEILNASEELYEIAWLEYKDPDARVGLKAKLSLKHSGNKEKITSEFIRTRVGELLLIDPKPSDHINQIQEDEQTKPQEPGTEVLQNIKANINGGAMIFLNGVAYTYATQDLADDAVRVFNRAGIAPLNGLVRKDKIVN